MARWPSGPYSNHRTGCYGCKRLSPSDGACGVHTYPCTHWGSDLFAITPEIYAPENGIVTDVSDGSSPPWSGYGPGIVLIKGVSGYYHLLAHMREIAVKPGPIAEGTFVGRYDRAIAHCHYEVRKNRTGPSDVNTINPEQWFRAQGGSGLGTLLILGGLLAAGWWLARSNVLAKYV